jgi:hypothetical protein
MPSIATDKLDNNIKLQKRNIKANEKDADKKKVNLGRAHVLTKDMFGPPRHECKTNYYGGYLVVRVEATSQTWNTGGGAFESGRAETKATETARLKAMEAAKKPVDKNCPKNVCEIKSGENLDVDNAVTISKRVEITATGTTKKTKGKHKYKATVLASCDWKYQVECTTPPEEEKKNVPKKKVAKKKVQTRRQKR